MALQQMYGSLSGGLVRVGTVAGWRADGTLLAAPHRSCPGHWSLQYGKLLCVKNSFILLLNQQESFSFSFPQNAVKCMMCVYSITHRKLFFFFFFLKQGNSQVFLLNGDSHVIDSILIV